MPNWVATKLTVEGLPESIAKMRFDVSKPVPYRKGEIGDTRKAGAPLILGHEPVPFALWNIVSPETEKWDEYFTTSGWVNGEQLGNTENNWYTWNYDNWGTKWDISDFEMLYESDNGDTWQISFETPWACPLPALDIFAARYPDLRIKARFIEENGWGGETIWEKGIPTFTREWGSPATHKEWEDVYGECRCTSEPERHLKFADCPEWTE